MPSSIGTVLLVAALSFATAGTPIGAVILMLVAALVWEIVISWPST